MRRVRGPGRISRTASDASGCYRSGPAYWSGKRATSRPGSDRDCYGHLNGNRDSDRDSESNRYRHGYGYCHSYPNRGSFTN